MIRLGITIVSLLFIVGCGDDTQNALNPLKKKTDQLAHHDKNNVTKFSNLYKHIKQVNKQLPKLNTQIHNQLIQQSKINKKSLTEVNENGQQQFNQLQKEINNFGNKMAKAGYKQS